MPCRRPSLLLLAALGPAVALRQAHSSGRALLGARAGVPGGQEENAYIPFFEDELEAIVPRGQRLRQEHPPRSRRGSRRAASSLHREAEEGNSTAKDSAGAEGNATEDASRNARPVLPFTTHHPHVARHACRQMVIPVVVLVIGGLASAAGKNLRTLSQLLLFFGAQTFMNLYMKAVLSTSVVQEVPRMTGFQAPLLLTAVQQLVSFTLLVVMLLTLGVFGYGFRPRLIKTAQEWLMVLFLAVSFTANIALNNFSLSLIDMSCSLMIRSAAPVSALLLQFLFRRWFQDALDQLSLAKLAFLFCGIACAAVVLVAKTHHNSGQAREFSHLYVLGIVLCVCSVMTCSMELILVVIIGKTIKLNPIETILYMSLPVVALLVAPSLCIHHVVAYEAHPPATDWSVLMEIWRLSPTVIVLVFLSGLFALGYNVLLYTVVTDLSPIYTSFAANFNKVGAIALALLFGFERLPAKPWNCIMVLAVLGNMLAFTAYSVWRTPAAAKKP